MTDIIKRHGFWRRIANIHNKRMLWSSYYCQLQASRKVMKDTVVSLEEIKKR